MSWYKEKCEPIPGHTLYLGDALVGVPALAREGVRVDMALFDPPYGDKWCSETHGVMAGDDDAPVGVVPIIESMMEDNTYMCVWGTQKSEKRWLPPMLDAGLVEQDRRIWIKNQRGGITGLSCSRNVEYVFVWLKGKRNLHAWTDRWGITGREPGSLIQQEPCTYDVPRPATAEDKKHPTPKPPVILERLIRNLCRPEGLVLDPFMGRCPGGIAAAMAGRDYVGIELDEDYYRGAVARYATWVPR